MCSNFCLSFLNDILECHSWLFISSSSLYPIPSTEFLFSMFLWVFLWHNDMDLTFFPNDTAVVSHIATLLQNIFWPELWLLPHSRTKVNEFFMSIYDIYFVYVLSQKLTGWSLCGWVAPTKDFYFFHSSVWSLED